MTYRIRPATADDVVAIQTIELAAGALFAEIGMQTIADDDPPSIDEVMGYVESSRAWVAIADHPIDNDDQPIGFALASTVDGEGHLDQVSVHPRHGRRGVGRKLIEQVKAWSLAQGFDALTLTTFVDVAFNGPYYRSLGFTPIEPGAMGPDLRAIRQAETDGGIDVAARTAMILHL